MAVEVEWTGREFRFLNCYVPVRPLERVEFLNRLRKYLTPKTFAAGDWNCVPDVTLDVQSKNPLGYKNIGAQLLEERMSEVGLIDEWREHLGEEKRPTRLGKTKRVVDGVEIESGIATSLDRFYVPTEDSLSDLLYTYKIMPQLVWNDKPSDHLPVQILIDTATGERGKDRLIPDESLVFSEEAQSEIIQILKESFKGHGSKMKKWTLANNKIAEYLTSLTKKARKIKSKELKKETFALETILRIIKKKGPTAAATDRVQELRKRIYKLNNPEPKALFTNKQSTASFERSDMCTAAYFAPFKTLSKQNWINEMKTAVWEEGKEPRVTGKTKSTKEVSGALRDYYKMLFESKITDDSELEKAVGLLRRSKILRKSKQNLDLEFGAKEVAKVMEKLPTGKSPGPNRVPNAVYKLMSRHFAPKFTEVLNELKSEKRLPKHFLEGDISVLYKKEARDDPRNYRPITLLNTDYKIFTRILANRFKEVVHEFVSREQKGFVPRELIQDCTLLLHMVEAYINEEPLERQGILLFFDMEKAFDRVSYKFLNKALEAIGVGEGFRNMVNLMYDEDHAPRRRILANGYYSDWFEIKSGVAQGCPLSPLLFLLVAEALNRTIKADSRIKGIKIGSMRYIISQFADDTTLLLRSKKEYKAALECVKRWGLATGMRENLKKREGLAMGRLRNKSMPGDTKWIKDGEWATSLGNPVGNDLNHTAFFKKKLEAVRAKAQRWVRLYRASYFGRNLIVQSMYFGSIRYWLYTLKMDRATKSIIQKEADTLWWSKDPDIQNGSKKVRRFVNKETAIGSRNKGGLANMDWKTHSEGFTSELIIRYTHPAQQDWKDILDELLFKKKDGTIWKEKEVLLYSKLSNLQKRKLRYRIPKNMKYIRECLTDFWNLNLIPAEPPGKREIGSESIWFNHSFEIVCNWRDREYFREITEVVIVSDIMNKATNKPFTRLEWRDWVEEMHSAKKNPLDLDNAFIIDKADKMMEIVKQIPKHIIRKLKRNDDYRPKDDSIVGISSEGEEPIYGYYSKQPRPKITKIWIDEVGYPHDTGEEEEIGNREIFRVTLWKGKWEGDVRIDGPVETSFPGNTKWKH